MADQTRRDAVEHAPQHEATARSDLNPHLFVISRSALWEWLERGALDLDALAIAGVAPSDSFIDEATVGGKICEVARATQQRLVSKGLLEMPMRALDRAVLMREPTIVARRRHAVMCTQVLVMPGEIVLGKAIEVAERRRQAVTTMLCIS